MKHRPLYEVVDGVIVWRGTKYQRAVSASQAKNTWILGGQRGGKTGWMVKWLVDEMVRCGPWGNAAQYAILTPNLQLGMGGAAKALRDLYCDQLRFFVFNGREYEFRTTKIGEQALWGHQQNVPTVIKMCYAENPRSFGSATFVGGITDEATMPEFRRESFQQFQARMGTFSGREAPFNPPEMTGLTMGRTCNGTTVWSLNWVKDIHDEWARAFAEEKSALEERCTLLDEAAEAAQRSEFSRRMRLGLIHAEDHFIRFPSTANPAVDPAWIEKCRNTWPDWLFRSRILAEFTKPTGVIFEDWDKSRHVVEPFHIPSAWEKWWAIDFGSKNFYALLVAYDPDRQRAFVTASYHRDDLMTHQHGAELSAFCPTRTGTVAGQISEDSYRVQLGAAGLPAMAAGYHDFWQGVGDLNAAIKQNRFQVFRTVPVDSLRGRARHDYPAQMPLGFSVGASGLADQLAIYSRPINPDTGEVMLDKEPEAKKTMHWVDAARYFATRKFVGWAGTPLTGSALANTEDAAPRKTTAPNRPVFTGEVGSMSLPGMMRAMRYGVDEACFEPPAERFY